MIKITIQELANKLNGRDYGYEITKEECDLAKDSGLIVIFGSSDDLCELRGAIDDEVECFGGGDFIIDDGIPIKVNWCDGDYAWTYNIEREHATFDILENDKKYCQGIVFKLKEEKEYQPTVEQYTVSKMVEVIGMFISDLRSLKDGGCVYEEKVYEDLARDILNYHN